MARSDPMMRHWYLLRKIEGRCNATFSELIDEVPKDYAEHDDAVYIVLYDDRLEEAAQFG